MKEDAELLRAFARQGDQDAFRELVGRHVGFVYASALRQLNGDAHLAADVAQGVFCDLARKARALSGHRVLAGWLFTSTRFGAAKAVRTERRRRAREQEAQVMDEFAKDPADALDWARARPVLDSALADLRAADREAILLRFFENLEYREIGTRLNLAENTARMRVDRALDTLRSGLARRGVTSTTAALAAALATEAVIAAPAGLATQITGAALASAGAASWWITFMSMTKLQVGITGALAVAAGTGFAVQARTNASLQAEVAQLRRETTAMPAVRAENRQLAREVAEAAALRNDNPDFVRMSTEVADLRGRLNSVTQRKVAAADRSAENVYDISKVDQLPRVKRYGAPPRYPFELRKAGVTGEVLVDFIVDQTGSVQKATVVKSTREEFEAPALESVVTWKFDAGVKGGRAVNTHMQVPIVFSLNDEKKAQPEPVPVPAPAPQG